MTRVEEEERADALQRDRAFVLNPALDTSWDLWSCGASNAPIVMLLWFSERAKKRPPVRWFTHGVLPEQERPALFDGPRIADTITLTIPGLGISWDDSTCDPIADIMRAEGHLVDISAAHHLEGHPEVTIVLLTRFASNGLPFPAKPGDRVRADGVVYTVVERKRVQPSHGAERVALLLVTPEEAPLPRVGSALILLHRP